MSTYKYYVDAGHGWLAVKRKELEAMGILGEVSSYSYTRGGTVYLEEDRDMALFFTAKGWTKWADAEEYVAYKNVGDRSPIRSYDRFVVEA